MNELTIYLAHALTKAPEEFRMRMAALRRSISGIRGVRLLEYAWKNGGPDPDIPNVYDHDMEQVRIAHLVIAVLDHISAGMVMEIKERCDRGGPIRCFVPNGEKLSKIVGDCIISGRARYLYLRHQREEMPDPIPYTNDDEIYHLAVDWVQDRLRRESRTILA